MPASTARSHPPARGRPPRRLDPVVIYIEDDAGNEPDFAALGSDGISVIVGRRNRTRARLFVRHPGEVQRLLRLLTEKLYGTASRSAQIQPT